MAVTKQKSSAEATANPTHKQYIKLRRQMQPGTHVRDLLDYLYSNPTITSYEAFKYLNNTRVSSTVSILRHAYGVPVVANMVNKNGKRYAVYSIPWGVWAVYQNNEER